MTSDLIELETPGILIELAGNPPMRTIFTKALLRSLFYKSKPLESLSMKQMTLWLKNCIPDLERIRRFRDICSCTGSSHLPLVYPETLFNGILGALITHPAFQLNPLGLIHLRQSITMHRAIRQNEILDARCRMYGIRQVEKGMEIECRFDVMNKEELVWEGIAVVLSKFNAKTQSKQQQKTKPEGISLPVFEIINVPSWTGRRYAAASGDYNPHHLYGITAKLFGFKKPIAHGMWSLSRAVSSLENKFDPGFPVRVDAAFKRPIFMPGSITLGYERIDNPDDEKINIGFELRDEHSGIPHLKGTMAQV